MGKKIILLLVLIMGVSLPLQAADNTAAAFSRANTDARITGMGMVGGTTATDATAVKWNPALLAEKNQIDLDFTSSTLFETNYLSAFYAQPGWGIGYTHAEVTGIQETTQDNNGRSQLTGTNHNFYGHVLYLGTGLRLSKTLAIGVTGKYIQESISSTNASGIGLDLGITYSPLSWVKTSLVAENLIPPTLTWNTASQTKETLPQIYKTGIKLDLIDTVWSIATELQKEESRPPIINIGTEFWPITLIALRAGYENNRLTLGTGLNFAGFRANASWESPVQTNLEDMYRFSLGLSF